MGITKEMLLAGLENALKRKFKFSTTTGTSYEHIKSAYLDLFNSIIECDFINNDLKRLSKLMLLEKHYTPIENFFKRIKAGRKKFTELLQQNDFTDEERKTIIQVYDKIEHKLTKVMTLKNKKLEDFARELRKAKLNLTEYSFDDFYDVRNRISGLLGVLIAWLRRCCPSQKESYCFSYAEVTPETFENVLKKLHPISKYYDDLDNEEFEEYIYDIEPDAAYALVVPKFLEFLDYLEKNVISKIKEPKECYPIHSIQKAISAFHNGLNKLKKELGLK